MSDAVVNGGTAPGYEAVAAAFAENFEHRDDVGAAFSAVVHGELVVDLWGGYADVSAHEPWTRDTLQLLFSGSKGLLAACLLLLVERGDLDVDASVATYWPEFSAHEKAWVTVGDVASHQAGLPVVRVPLTADDLLHPRRMGSLVADQAPLWPGARRASYHALTYGWLCGELVQRVTGMTIGSFFAAEIADKLQLELWIGLPERHEPRVSTLLRHPLFKASPPPTSPEGALVYGNPDLFAQPLVWNRPAFHRAEIPGVNAIGTARSMARFYGCLANNGELNGTRLLRPESIRLARRELARGHDPLFGDPLAFGLGFALPTEADEFGPPPDAFGHNGAGGSIHGAWPSLRTGFSYAMNEMRDETRDDRGRALLLALHSVLTEELATIPSRP